MAGGVGAKCIADIAKDHLEELTTAAALMTISGLISEQAEMMEACLATARAAAVLTELIAAARGCDFMQAAEDVSMRSATMASAFDGLLQA